MALTDNDRLFIKYAGITEKDFEKMSGDDQDKVLSDGFKKYKAARKIKSNSELFTNAKDVIPKIKEILLKSPKVYVKKLGAGKSTTEAIIVGYSQKNDKFLAISPTVNSEKIKIIQLDESDIIIEPGEM